MGIGLVAPLFIVGLICAVSGWGMVYVSARIKRRRTERRIEEYGDHDTFQWRRWRLEPAEGAPMFKILAMIFIGILTAIGFFDLGQEAYTLAALLLGIGALLDYGRKRTTG
jgi:hypothetical protein